MLSAPPFLRRLRAERRSAASLEFVLVAPVLIVILFGVYDISSALITYQEIYDGAHSIAASLSNEAVQADGTTALTYDQVQQGASLIWAQIPALRADYQDGAKSVTISSIVFQQTSTSATCGQPGSLTPCYTPVVVWSEVYTGGDSGRTFQTPTNNFTTIGGVTTWTAINSPMRSCIGTATIPVSQPLEIGSLNQTTATAGAASDLTNLRTITLGDTGTATAPPSPILVVDVHLAYKPVIGILFGTPINFWINAYWPVRSVKVTTSSTTPLTQAYTTINAKSLANTDSPTYTNGVARSPNDYCINSTLTTPGPTS